MSCRILSKRKSKGWVTDLLDLEHRMSETTGHSLLPPLFESVLSSLSPFVVTDLDRQQTFAHAEGSIGGMVSLVLVFSMRLTVRVANVGDQIT